MILGTAYSTNGGNSMRLRTDDLTVGARLELNRGWVCYVLRTDGSEVESQCVIESQAEALMWMWSTMHEQVS